MHEIFKRINLYDLAIERLCRTKEKSQRWLSVFHPASDNCQVGAADHCLGAC